MVPLQFNLVGWLEKTSTSLLSYLRLLNMSKGSMIWSSFTNASHDMNPPCSNFEFWGFDPIKILNFLGVRTPFFSHLEWIWHCTDNVEKWKHRFFLLLSILFHFLYCCYLLWMLGTQEDAHLLLGVYLHGFGNWTVILKNPDLYTFEKPLNVGCLSFLSVPQIIFFSCWKGLFFLWNSGSCVYSVSNL